MSEPTFSTHSGRVQHHAQDLTPYSAVCPEECYSTHWYHLQRAFSDSNHQVSSFNLPAQYDSSLITPVSLTSSPSMPTKSAPSMRKETEIRLSPANMSPGYHLFCGDDEFASPRYNPPMKLKDPSGILHISTADNSFPPSPYVCTSPYYGSFGVSATPQSARTTNSSPGVHPSPNLQSAGGLSSTGSHHSRQQTPATSTTSYRSNFQAPILIAPHPEGRKPATNNGHGPFRQSSLQSNQSNQSSPHSQSLPQETFTETLSSMPQRGKKRKDPPSDYEAIVRSGEINAEEQLLLQLSGRDKLPWKEVAAKFNKATGQSKKVAALQMRKKRLMERLRVWTDAESNSLSLAHEDYEKGKWSSISKGMLKHGTQEKWSKEALEKKWSELHPEEPTFSPEYELVPRNRHRGSSDFSVGDLSTGQSSWSDEGESSSHSLNDCDSATLLSALSTATIDEARNRALNNVNAQIHLQRQQQQQQQRQQQQQMMFEQQHQHRQQNGWDSGP